MNLSSSVLSSRNKRKLVHESHIYTFCKKTKNGANDIWVCERRGSCKGRIWTDVEKGEVVKVVKEHNHAAQAARPEVVALMRTIKERAVATQEDPQELINKVIAETGTDVSEYLPKTDTIKRMIRRTRQEEIAPTILSNVVVEIIEK